MTAYEWLSGDPNHVIDVVFSGPGDRDDGIQALLDESRELGHKFTLAGIWAGVRRIIGDKRNAADKDKRGIPSLAVRKKLAAYASQFEKAPRVTPQSSRHEILAWLQWNDPNGQYVDEATLGEFEPTPAGLAWAFLQDNFDEDDTYPAVEAWEEKYGR
jgi:hypothetical protein